MGRPGCPGGSNCDDKAGGPGGNTLSSILDRAENFSRRSRVE